MTQVLKPLTHLYSYGLPFSERLGENIKDLIARVESNKASLIIIDGFMGEGKTTLAVEVADYINQAYDKPPINFEEQLGQGGEEFQEKLRLCYEKKLPCIIYDEAGDFNRRGAMTKFNALLNRTFETFRAFKIIPILCLPSFRSIDKPVFDKGVPRLLIHVTKRGKKQGNFRAYSLYRMFYILKKMDNLTVKPQAYDIVEPNVYGHFLDLEPGRAASLARTSTKSKFDILRESEIECQGLLGYDGMAEQLNRSVGFIRHLALTHKVKHCKVIRYKKYFDQKAFLRIQNLIGNRDTW